MIHKQNTSPVIGGALLSKEWSSMDVDDVLVKLRTSLQGLSADEVDYRSKRDGKNKLIEPPITPAWKKFLEQFIDPLVFLLIAAAFISIGCKRIITLRPRRLAVIHNRWHHRNR